MPCVTCNLTLTHHDCVARPCARTQCVCLHNMPIPLLGAVVCHCTDERDGVHAVLMQVARLRVVHPTMLVLPSWQCAPGSRWTPQGHLIRNWKRRLFVLTPTSLRYYGDATKRDIKGEIDIGNIREIRAPSAGDTLFELRTIRGKDFRLRADTNSDAAQWAKDIHTVRVAPSPHLQLQLEVQAADAAGTLGDEVRVNVHVCRCVFVYMCCVLCAVCCVLCAVCCVLCAVFMCMCMCM